MRIFTLSSLCLLTALVGSGSSLYSLGSDLQASGSSSFPAPIHGKGEASRSNNNLVVNPSIVSDSDTLFLEIDRGHSIDEIQLFLQESSKVMKSDDIVVLALPQEYNEDFSSLIDQLNSSQRWAEFFAKNPPSQQIEVATISAALEKQGFTDLHLTIQRKPLNFAVAGLIKKWFLHNFHTVQLIDPELREEYANDFISLYKSTYRTYGCGFYTIYTSQKILSATKR